MVTIVVSIGKKIIFAWNDMRFVCSHKQPLRGIPGSQVTSDTLVVFCVRLFTFPLIICVAEIA